MDPKLTELKRISTTTARARVLTSRAMKRTLTFAAAVLLASGCGSGFEQADIDAAVAEALAERAAVTTTAATTTTLAPEQASAKECFYAAAPLLEASVTVFAGSRELLEELEERDFDSAEETYREVMLQYVAAESSVDRLRQSCPAEDFARYEDNNRQLQQTRRPLVAACRDLNSTGLTNWDC